MIDDRATPVRRAALLLHAMAPADRAWMLAQLPEGARIRLQALLRELVALGIPHDAALLRQVAATRAPAEEPILDVPRGDPGSDVPFATVAGADAARLAAVLRDEPADLVATLLAVRDWTWRDAFLRQLGPLRARQVTECLAARRGDARLGKAGERALLAAVVRRLRDVPPDAAHRAVVGIRPDAPSAKPSVWRPAWLGHGPAPLTRGRAR